MPNAQPLHSDRLRALPKAEVHAHLEGCFEPTHWSTWQGRLPDMIDAIDAGLTAAVQDGLSLCSKAFGWSDGDLRALARNSIDASFANADVKARLTQALSSW